MFFAGIGVATPPNFYSQPQCWSALNDAPQFAALSGRSKAILKKVLLGDNGIQKRALAVENLQEAFELNPDALQRRFATAAPIVATAAARRALEQSGKRAEEIDAVLISTCTGYLCPGLTSYVSESLGLRSDVMALDLVGQGCGAALPNLATANALIASRQCACVLTVCVEICSAAFFLDNDPGVLISACLFGDGAAAAVLTKSSGPGRRIEWLDSASRLNPKDRDLLRFEHRGGMLRNVLDKSVPLLVVEQNLQALADVLKKTSLRRSDIAQWILHSGGRDVLAALRTGLELREEDLRWSAGVLRDYGNVSSPSVLFALKSALDQNAPGGFWYMSAFGAGIACHGAMLRVS